MIIIAVDFDGTLCDFSYPDIGAPNNRLIEELISERQSGNKIILWTCRENDKLIEAINWCKNLGLEFDAVNDNLKESIDKFGGSNSRKIHADIYIDDKSCIPQDF